MASPTDALAGMSLVTKLFGTYSDHQIKKIRPTLARVNDLAGKYRDLSDAEMAEVTLKFKESLKNGSTLDDILPDAYALVREAADRVLGKRPFDVQVLCGILLHQGRVAEMKTGEGKTLVATLPSYLNALSGKGVHVVTVNEYLARLGCEEMGLQCCPGESQGRQSLVGCHLWGRIESDSTEAT